MQSENIPGEMDDRLAIAITRLESALNLPPWVREVNVVHMFHAFLNLLVLAVSRPLIEKVRARDHPHRIDPTHVSMVESSSECRRELAESSHGCDCCD